MTELYESPYIFGIHEPGGEPHMAQAGRKGWIVFTEGVGSDPNEVEAGGAYNGDYTPWSKEGFGVIVRLNNAYKPNGTLPHRDKYEDFARRCGNFVRASQGCHTWILGNEMNFWVERPGAFASRDLPVSRETDELKRDGFYRALPDRFSALHPELPMPRGGLHGEEIYPDDYARCYTLCRNAIKAQPGHEEDQVLVGAVAPWNNNTRYAGNEEGDWIQYFQDILTRLGPLGCDGVTLHTYTHGPDPSLISAVTTMSAPFQQRHYDFQAYQDFMEAIPADMRHLPVYITETDQDKPWQNANTGWVKQAYAEIDGWNRTPGRQQIRALVLYRWPNVDQWVIEGKQGVIDDFWEALQNEYRWSTQEVVTPPAQLAPAPFQIGTRVYTTTIVRLRRTPGVVGKDESDTLGEIPLGVPATILGGPRSVDNYVWWRLGIQLPGGGAVTGWAAQALAEDVPLLTTEKPSLPHLAPGQQVFTLDMVRLRRTPGFRDKADSDVLADLPMDARVTVVGGPQATDGLLWWQVEANLGGAQPLVGWAAQTALTGQPLLAPADSIPEPQPEPQPAGKYAPGDTLYAVTYVNLRRTPGYVNKTGDDVLAEIPYGGAVTVEGGPRQADELAWWHVRYTTPEGQVVSGWVAESGTGGEVLFATEPPPPPPPSPVEVPAVQAYSLGMSVCNISPYEVNIRRSPGYMNKPDDDVVAVVPSQALLQLAEGPQEADGLFWWRVQGVEDPNLNGWMAEVSPAGIRLLAPALYRGLINLGIPYEGDHPVSQLWGENPDFYSRFTYGGVPLRGHNGIDIYMPTGTPILAAESGVVKIADFNPGGFGNWVRVDHRWGHSVYAHMNRFYVRPGQQVQRGEVLGESDNTGNSTGPHLHFSIRINPYNRRDGWGGFCDPMPFMDQSKLNLSLYSRDLRQIPDIPRFDPTPPPPELPGRPLP